MSKVIILPKNKPKPVRPVVESKIVRNNIETYFKLVGSTSIMSLIKNLNSNV